MEPYVISNLIRTMYIDDFSYNTDYFEFNVGCVNIFNNFHYLKKNQNTLTRQNPDLHMYKSQQIF